MGNRNSYDRLVLAAAHKIKERDYWLHQLSGHLEKSTFPYDLNYKGAHSNQVDLSENQKPPLDRVKFQFPPSLAAKALKLSDGLDIKLHMILVTGLVILQHKYSGSIETDIIIGSPILKQKTDREFINTVLVFRNRTKDHMLFKELLLNVRETIINANENQNYPLEILANQLKLPVTGKEFPLFDIVLQMENLHDKAYIQDIPYKMLFSFLRTGEAIEGFIEYNWLLYRESGIKPVIRYYLHVLEQALDNVNIPLSHIRLMTQPERNRVLFDFNRTNRESETGYPGDKTLHELFVRQVQKAPDQVALVALSGQIPNPKSQIPNKEESFGQILNVFGGVHLSYGELNEKAGQLAYLLIEKGVQTDTIVGIMVEQSIEMIIGILGILNAGGAYLPIDPDYPQERIDYMLADSSAKILLTRQEIAGLFSPQALNNRPKGTSSFGIWDLEFGISPRQGGQLAYVIYTSGTTGKPKGVMVEHANVIAYIHAFYREFAVSHRDTVIQLNSFAFDAFVEEVFPLLLTGGKIVIPGILEMIDINLLSRLILKQDVTIVDCTPLLLNEFNRLTADNLKNVRLFISGGDILKAEYVDNLITVGKVYNTYGPTETTVCATYYRCRPAQPPAGFSTTPIGKPISNYYVYILGKNQQPLPVGISGELCISGFGVARGYLNNPGLTNQKFLRGESRCFTGAVFSKSVPPGRRRQKLYRTGDLARWHPDGNIECLGRIDHQVKIRGYRIELEEIESHLLSHPKIKEAVVIAREDETSDKYLCAYVVPEAPGLERQPIHTALREYLSRRLPAYMVPVYIVPIDSIPLNRSGKVDKSKLPAPGIARTREYVPPTTIMEKNLAAIFSQLLNTNIEKIGINDDFFERGGNSLKLIKLTTQIQEQFNIHIPLNHILKNCSIKELSRLIVNKRFTSIEDEAMVLLNQAKGGNIFFFPPGIGYGITYMEFALLLENHSVYAFNFIDDNDILETYTENIMQIQPAGSLVLSAYSAGGRLCLKAAEILEKKGREVSDIILMECFLYPKKLEIQEIEEMAKKFFHDFKTRLIELGLQSLTTKAIQKIKNYSKFSGGLTDLKPVSANIHFIKAGDKKHMKEPGGWKTLTRNKYTVYTGFAKHELMLAPGAIEKNAEIINKILNKEAEADNIKSKK